MSPTHSPYRSRRQRPLLGRAAAAVALFALAIAGSATLCPSSAPAAAASGLLARVVDLALPPLDLSGDTGASTSPSRLADIVLADDGGLPAPAQATATIVTTAAAALPAPSARQHLRQAASRSRPSDPTGDLVRIASR